MKWVYMVPMASISTREFLRKSEYTLWVYAFKTLCRELCRAGATRRTNFVQVNNMSYTLLYRGEKEPQKLCVPVVKEFVQDDPEQNRITRIFA